MDDLSGGVAEVQQSEVCIDFTSMLNLSKKDEDLEEHIFQILKKISDKTYEEKTRKGLLIVLVDLYTTDGKLLGVRQVGDNPLGGKTLYAYSDKFEDVLYNRFADYDGALIINRITGQLIAAKIFLVVNHPEIEIENDCATRHIAAASMSKQPNVLSCFTLSEETSKVRMYKQGLQKDNYNPAKEEQISEDSFDDISNEDK